MLIQMAPIFQSGLPELCLMELKGVAVLHCTRWDQSYLSRIVVQFPEQLYWCKIQAPNNHLSHHCMKMTGHQHLAGSPLQVNLPLIDFTYPSLTAPFKQDGKTLFLLLCPLFLYLMLLPPLPCLVKDSSNFSYILTTNLGVDGHVHTSQQ